MVENKFVEYVHYKTGEVLYTDFFYDPELSWVRLNDGSIYLNSRYGGHPTEEWLKNNPQPKG